MHRLTSIGFLLLAACSIGAPVDYYDGRWDPPTIQGVEADSQAGNVSGRTVVISGSGFGDDPSVLMVQFGSANAEIVDVSDTELTVTAPPGPVGGGTVRVRVGSSTGYADADYTYAVGDEVVEGAGDEQPDEVGYVLVNNYWESCLGGLSGRLGDEWGVTDCEEIAYVGTTGLDGSAEAIEFAARRLYAPTQGWSGAADLGDGEWRVERPGEMPYLGGLDDFHVDLGRVSVRNDFFDEGDGYCVDLDATASFRYGGGVEGYPDPVVVSGEAFPTVKKADGGECETGIYYPANELQFCPGESAEGVPDHVYAADWPIDEHFFQAHQRNMKPVEVELRMPDIGVDGVKVQLPEPLVVYNTEGYEDIADGQTGAQDLWGAYGVLQHCYDDDDNGERLDDGALLMEWEVSDFEPTPPGGAVLRSRTYVRMSFTQLSLGWFGGINYPVRATVTVPDAYETYKYEGDEGKVTRSRLVVPASIMYQLPTIAFPPSGGLSGDVYAVPGAANYGYMFIELQRVTEYTIATNVGPVVFAYVTGDFGFTEWTNPNDDTCHDCLDGDGDGWIDEKDPDCDDGIEEIGTTAANACNDGLDNDGDGDVDAEDTECDSATGEDESNCANGLDDDDDGYEDEDDADCQRGENESTADGCTDGLDNDADGWSDLADPDCLSGAEEVGYGDDGCNDGTDEDADGWTDAADPDCVGASFDEVGVGTGECNDGVDNDADNVTDAADLDCTDAFDASELP